MVPVQVQSSEKSLSPQPFTEPENMTTIELNKSDLEVPCVTENETPKKFKIYTIAKPVSIGIGLFIVLGLCTTSLLLLVHRGYSKNSRAFNESSNIEETSFKILLSDKDKITACKTSKSFEDCCYVSYKTNALREIEKCSVAKVLKLFLEYEIAANKRSKRQNWNADYENQRYSPDYYQENNYDPGGYDFEYPSNFDAANINDYQYGYRDVAPNNDGQDPNTYYQDTNNYQIESPQYFPDYQYYQNQERSAVSHAVPETTSTTPKAQNFGKQLKDTKPTTNFPLIVAKTPPKVCPDDNCPPVIKASATIGNITNVKANSSKLKIALNDTKITLTPSARISQGSDFELKPTGESQSSGQIKQLTPCYYPFSSPYGTGYNPSPIFGVMPNPNLQRQALYVINPPVYQSAPLQYPGFNNYQNPQIVNKNSIQVAGAGGQYYLCNPVSIPTSNVAGLQGVEIRRESFTLQDLVESMEKSDQNNKTREAIDCPFGTHSCRDGSKCIHHRQVCDNEVNCIDGSDEMDCSCKNRVGEIRWCDGYLDCPNGEDEQACFECDSEEFSCDDWSRFQRGTCVPLSQRCDGIKQCEITGKDEEDCSILVDHLGQHSFHKVSNSAGFLHRNYKGKWYPTCFGADIFSLEVCQTETGPTEMAPRTHLVPTNDNYPGPFLDVSPNEGVTLADTCMNNKAAFVECPPLFCGLRLTISNPFRNAEVDTSAEEFLARTRLFRKSQAEQIVGDSRVVGGKPSQPTAWPWVVSIYKNGVFHCGGVLINEFWILTAAHCVDRFWFFYYEIQAGILRRFSYSPMEQTRWATAAIPHQDYNKKSLTNDIALMKLSKPVRFNRYVRPICLPSETTAGEDFLQGPKPNTVCITVGWGATVEHGADPDHLREVEIPILPHCKHAEDKEGDEICAGLLEGGRDACQGDSGGPLMCQNIKNRSQWYLAGIVSHGEGCARPDEPGVYTKVSKYVGWINDNKNGKTVGRVPLQKCPGYICTGTKRCISKKRHCDKIIDCLFGDDELNCWEAHEPSHFRSDIVGSRRNFFNSLIDLFSEVATNSTDKFLGKDVLPSLNQLSESKNDRKTIVNDTKDGSETAIFSNKFVCENMLQIIPFYEKCDKVVNCEDGTDESNCSCVDYLKRVDKDAICDGITDCKDMTDESNCVKCAQSQYLCRISQKCILSKKRCDGHPDCINAEDEWDCVALTDGRTLVLDSDLRPKQSMKGIITINRFGVWRPLCTNASVDNAASIAANVCNLLGFEEYTVFHKLSVSDKPLNVTIGGLERLHSSLELPLCGGLFVRCLNVSLNDNIHRLHLDNITSQVELYTSPWNAVIYLDGEFRCTGTILNPHWIITARTCFQKPFQTDSYISVLLGKGKAHLDVEGPHEQLIVINEIAFVEQSDAIVLHSQQKINFNRYVQPAQISANSLFIKEQCVAIGFQEKKSKTLLLQPEQKCAPGFRCFNMTTVCKIEKSEPWNGVITCNSREGWYTAAIYSNLKDPCGFSQQKFANVSKFRVEMAMGNEVQKLNPPDCKGFRCSLGQCIQENKVCNGITDCRNGEDEDSDLCSKLATECPLSTNCTNLPSCTWAEFKCKNGNCVPKTSFCDTINDCGDNSDEPEECSCGTYMETVHPEKICDGIVHCWDHSDENPEKCPCQFPTNTSCGQTDLCVSQEMVCDGFKDCPGGEDESLCYSLKAHLTRLISGEVITRTAGVWHSGCFARNHTTTELEEICERLGFAGGSARQMIPAEGVKTTRKPVKDRFDVVWIRRGGNGLKLRFRTGNEPYFRFVEDSDCHKLFIECDPW